MTKYLWMLGLVLLAGCTEQQPTNNRVSPKTIVANEALPETKEFFTEWFKSHGHTDVVADQRGVGVGNNATRLNASLYGENEHDDGTYVVEVEFRVRLPSGREIVEFVAGVGDSKEQAINDAMLNFTLTTFHVIYKGFINTEDAHIESKQLEIEGQKREVITGDIYMRGQGEGEPIDLNTMHPMIESALSGLHFTPEAHWLKIIYSQHEGKPMTVSASLDNEEDQALTDAIAGLAWPESQSFYMIKQFIVINEKAN